MNKLTGTLLYVCVQEPTKAYVKAGEDPKPDEWKVSICLTDEDDADAYQEFVEKTWKSKASMKKVKAAEFEGIYKCPVPEGAGKNVWVVTIRKSTELGKTGKPVPDLYRPRVYLQEGNVRNEITNEKLVGNGSKGSVSFEVFEKRDGSGNIILKNVLVTDLVEYTKASSDYKPGSEFDDEDEPVVEQQKQAKEAPKKAKPKADDIPDDDIPF